MSYQCLVEGCPGGHVSKHELCVPTSKTVLSPVELLREIRKYMMPGVVMPVPEQAKHIVRWIDETLSMHAVETSAVPPAFAITICQHGVDLTQRACRLCPSEEPEVARGSTCFADDTAPGGWACPPVNGTGDRP